MALKRGRVEVRYHNSIVGRSTQPEPAWSNPMFNSLGGRNLLVHRTYGAGATVGQGTTPMPGGFYRPGSEYNWYSYAGSDPVNGGDLSGYWNPWKFAGGLGLTALGVAQIVVIGKFGLLPVIEALMAAEGGATLSSLLATHWETFVTTPELMLAMAASGLLPGIIGIQMIVSSFKE